MRGRLIQAFFAGSIVSLILVGTTSFLRAADDDVISSCVNRRTGVMRHLTKGACSKRTETLLTWNRVGLNGSSGEKGDVGETGPRGDAGPRGEVGARGERGEAGAQGPRGQNVIVKDSTGKNLGLLVGIDGDTLDVLTDDLVWVINDGLLQNRILNFLDSNCTTPTILSNEGLELWQARPAFNGSNQLVGAWAATGTTSPQGSRTIYTQSGGLTGPLTCSPSNLITNATLYEVSPVDPLNFTTPLRITTE